MPLEPAKGRSLIRYALVVGQARIAFIVVYSLPTLNLFHFLYRWIVSKNNKAIHFFILIFHPMHIVVKNVR